MAFHSILASIGSLLYLVLVSCGAPSAEAAAGEVGDTVLEALRSGTESFDHTSWDELLRQGTREGFVDYEYFEANTDTLDSYLAEVASAPLDDLTRDHLWALLANAYNALTIRSILEHPGIESIREIEGVWDQRRHVVGGFELTLDNLEHNLLRPYFKDPRVHFAVNCASRSCAPMPPWAFDGERLDEQLDEWTRRFFANPRNTRIDDDTLMLSKLLSWYGEDFTDPEASPRADSLAEFVSRYASDEVREFLERAGSQPKIGFLDYDWRLNTVKALGDT